MGSSSYLLSSGLGACGGEGEPGMGVGPETQHLSSVRSRGVLLGIRVHEFNGVLWF